MSSHERDSELREGVERVSCCDCCVAKAARSPQAEDHENCPDCWGGRPKWAGTMPAPPCPTCGGTGKRSPQGEDHEARSFTICTRCWVVVGIDGENNLDRATTVCSHLGPFIQASPSRDGTVAVEALRAIRTFAGEGPHTHMGEACGIDACIGCLIYATADEALAEFGSARAAER